MKIRDPRFDLTILQVVVKTCGKGEEKNIYILASELMAWGCCYKGY